MIDSVIILTWLISDIQDNKTAYDVAEDDETRRILMEAMNKVHPSNNNFYFSFFFSLIYLIQA